MGPSVLLVDNDPDERRLVATLLDLGPDAPGVIEAADAGTFLNRLREGGFSVAIAAARLGWADGVAVLAAVKRHHPACATVLLGRADLDETRTAFEMAGVDAVVARSCRGLLNLPARVRALAGQAPGGEPAAEHPAGDARIAPVRSPSMLQEVSVALSHDLQDPLQIILHSAQRLGGEADHPLAPDDVRRVERIVANAERMQRMLDALVDIARAAPNEPAREPVPLEAVIDDAVHDLEERLAPAGGEVVCSPLPVVTGDRQQLRRVFDNLLGNAIKFASDQPPRIAIQAIDAPADWLISVTDNGIGIDTADAERVFTMFARSHESRGYPGSGVGLAICRRIVRAHGGDIWVQPAPGGGSTFFVRLPKHESGECTKKEGGEGG